MMSYIFGMPFMFFQILYGQNWHLNSLKNYRQQHSPLIAEFLKVTPENQEILKIGCEKYLGYEIKKCQNSYVNEMISERIATFSIWNYSL